MDGWRSLARIQVFVVLVTLQDCGVHVWNVAGLVWMGHGVTFALVYRIRCPHERLSLSKDK